MADNNDIGTLIDERQLSQWHLMVASLLGSLASQEGMFNQAFLNRILKHSMDEFIIPYFQTLPKYQDSITESQQASSLTGKLRPVVEFIDEVFNLAGQVEISENDSGLPVLRIGSSSCRFCPVGVGNASITPGKTFCPFPTMIEETANVMLKTVQIKTLLERDGTKTRILKKHDGSCYITYEIKSL